MRNSLHTEKYATFSQKYATFSLFFHLIFLCFFRKFPFMAVLIMKNHDRNRFYFESGIFQLQISWVPSSETPLRGVTVLIVYVWMLSSMSFPIFFPWAEFQTSPLQPLWQVLFNVRWHIASFVAIKILTHLRHTSIVPHVLHVVLKKVQKVIHVELCRTWCLQTRFLLMFHEPISQTIYIYIYMACKNCGMQGYDSTPDAPEKFSCMGFFTVGATDCSEENRRKYRRPNPKGYRLMVIAMVGIIFEIGLNKL